ncbi:MAG: FtsX-like permease family protein [Candidatus Aminicenantales bacterium]
MIPIARRMIWREKARFFITAGGLGLTAMLMMFLLGVYEGVKRGSTGYVRECPAGIWACDNNSTNLLRSSSFMPAALESEFYKTEGVEDAAAILRVLATTRIKGKPVTLFLFGFDPKKPMARPARILQGNPDIGPGELIVDRAFAAKFKLALGDPVEIQGRSFRVAAVGEGMNAVVTQFVFTTLEDAQKLLGFPGVVSFFLLSLKPGAPMEAVLRDLKKSRPALSFFTKDEFIRNNLDEMETGVLPIFWTIAVLGAITGAAVIALMLYGSVLEKREDYALLKAIGARPRFLLTLILKQSLIVSVSGFLIGLALEAALSPALRNLVPSLSVVMTVRSILAVFAAVLLIGGLGSAAPVRKLSRIFPMEVFR